MNTDQGDKTAVTIAPGELLPSVAPGLSLHDFRIDAKLGEGAMGVVYKAHQLSMDRVVALKILPAHLAANAEFVERFKKEARMSAKLQHPNIIGGIAVGEENGLHYFAMEFVDGENLEQWQSRLDRLSVGDAVRVGLDVAHALAHAYERGVLHRDIKPANIMISLARMVKLADLGLAKVEGDDGRTQIGEMAGTLAYMAPEQARNAKTADHRCDLYALGVTLYVLLTGKKPFTATTPIEWVEAKEKGTFLPPSRLNPNVPEALDRILAKLIAPDPRRRYQTADALIADLQATQLVGSKLYLDSPTIASQTLPIPPRRSLTRLRSTGLAVVVLLLIGTGAAYWMWTTRTPAPIVTQPQPPVQSAPPVVKGSTDAIVSGSIERLLAGEVDAPRALLRQGVADHPDAPALTRMLAELEGGQLLLFQYETPNGISPVVPFWIADGVTLTPRDNYRFAIGSGRTCYVYVFQRDTRPSVTPIFPNPQYSKLVNPLEAGHVYWLPDKSQQKDRAWIFLDTSIGEEQMYFIAATRPLRNPDALGQALVNGADAVSDGLTHTPDTWLDTSAGQAEPCFNSSKGFMEVFRFNHK